MFGFVAEAQKKNRAWLCLEKHHHVSDNQWWNQISRNICEIGRNCMASSEARRRKQLEKKKKKRAEKHREIVARRDAGLAEQLSMRSKAPVYQSLVSVDLDQKGLGEVLISRCTASGEIVFGLFLIDRYCMGVKDCFGQIGSSVKYREFLDQMADRGRELRAIDPASARRLVEDAVAYAESLGLKPHPDYRAVRMILGDIDPSKAVETFEFGMDGKPYFMSGPFQSPAECQAICAKLKASCGEGGFHYMVPLHAGVSLPAAPDWNRLSFDDEDEDFEEDFGDDEETARPRDVSDVPTGAKVIVVEPDESQRSA